MIDSEPSVLSWIVLVLEGNIGVVYAMSEVLWEEIIIKYASDVAQEIDNE